MPIFEKCLQLDCNYSEHDQKRQEYQFFDGYTYKNQLNDLIGHFILQNTIELILRVYHNFSKTHRKLTHS